MHKVIRCRFEVHPLAVPKHQICRGPQKLSGDIKILSVGRDPLALGGYITIPEKLVGHLARAAEEAPDASKVVADQASVERVGGPNAIHRCRPLQPLHGHVLPVNEGCSTSATDAQKGAGVFRLEELEMLMIDGVSGPAIRNAVQ